ncbi:hypothetical protein ACIRPX_05105 [Streptomyces sp. NPDC101225]|uniref:hypothetical protein n=1 Tax=Streptomyces sp. NPDC101225 TaxID=3366135 RepID=UPI0037FCE2B5
MSMSVGIRRILVRHLADRDMPPAKIASELGISRETVRRDLHSSRHTRALVLDLDEALSGALAVLRSVHGVPDTLGQNVAAARAAIRATADAVTDARTPVRRPVTPPAVARHDGA